MLLWLLSYRQGLWTLCPGIHRYRDYNHICIPTQHFTDTVVWHTIDLFEDNVSNEPHPWTLPCPTGAVQPMNLYLCPLCSLCSSLWFLFYATAGTSSIYVLPAVKKLSSVFSFIILFRFPFSLLFHFCLCHFIWFACLFYFIMHLHSSQLSNYQLLYWRIVQSFSIKKNCMQQLNYIFLCTMQRSKATG